MPASQINANDYKKRMDSFEVSLDLSEPDFVSDTLLKSKFPINKFINARKGNLKYTTMDDFWQSTHPTKIKDDNRFKRYEKNVKPTIATTKVTPTKSNKISNSNLSKKSTPMKQQKFGIDDGLISKEEENREKENNQDEVRRTFVSSSFDWDEDYGNYDYTKGSYGDYGNDYNYYDYNHGSTSVMQKKMDRIMENTNKVEEDLMKIDEFDSIFKAVPKNNQKKVPISKGGDTMSELTISEEKEYDNGLRVWKVSTEKNNHKSDFPSFSSSTFGENNFRSDMGPKKSFLLTPLSSASGFMKQGSTRKSMQETERHENLKPFGSEMDEYFSKSSGLDRVHEAFKNLKQSMNFESKKMQKKQVEYQESLSARTIENESPIEKLEKMVKEKNNKAIIQQDIRPKTNRNVEVEKRYLRPEHSKQNLMADQKNRCPVQTARVEFEKLV